jgi:hypothetical protein
MGNKRRIEIDSPGRTDRAAERKVTEMKGEEQMEASEKGRSRSMNPAPDHLGQMEKKVATRGSRAGPLLPPSLPIL